MVIDEYSGAIVSEQTKFAEETFVVGRSGLIQKFVVLEQGETGIFIDYEAEKPNDAYEGHGSIAGRFGVKLLPSELTDEPNLNEYGFTPV